MQEISNQILQTLRNSQKILLVTHKRPDGDAIGSTLALYRVLANSFGKDVQLAVQGPIPLIASVLVDGFRLQDSFWPDGIDTVVLLDCAGWTRTGFFETDELNIDWPTNLIVIDHHAVSTPTPGLHLIKPEISSAAELVAMLLEEWGVPMDSETATCLWAGMASDTSYFRHANTSEQTLEIAAKLLARGADIERVAATSVGTLSPTGMQLWGRVLSRMKYEGGILVSKVSVDDLTEIGANQQDVDGLIGLMNRVAGIKMAMLLIEIEPGKWKVSLRTEQEMVNVAQLAQFFGGGGHTRAAGFEYLISA